MGRNTVVWRKLYKLSDQLQKLKPWEYIWSGDYICIELAPDDVVYCIVMGRNGDCIGLSIYEGEEGYADLCSLSREYDDLEVTKYLMFEQNCLTWYMGDRSEVPAEQRAIIKNLGLKYRGSQNWPYFISYEAQYYPNSINEEEAERFVQILERLLDILEEYIHNHIDVQFEDNEMIYAHQKDEQWIYESMSVPYDVDKFMPIELTDSGLYEELEEREQINQNLYIDLLYLNTVIQDDDFKKPANALMFIVVDEETEVIMHGDLLKPGDDEIEVILNFFIPFILETGIPKKVHVRNPNVHAAIVDICERCHIQIDMGNMGVVDNIIDEMKEIM